MTQENRELEWLRRARELSHRLVEEIDPARLLPLILDSAIELAGAERGFLVRLSGPEGLKVVVARGFGGQELASAGGAVSRSVVQEVLERGGEGIVTTREQDRDLLNASTVQARRVLAILCVPMRLRKTTVGVIYLDHRFVPDAFHASDLEPLRLFADQAALAIEGAEQISERDRALAELEQIKGQLREHESLERRRRRLLAVQRSRRQAGEPPRLGNLVGESEAAQGVFAAIERAGRTRDPVLVIGETGVGKSAVAAELHRLLGTDQPLVTAHCVSTDPAQLRAAVSQAGAGTLVLEGIGDASPELQAELVVLLQQQRAGEGQVRIVTTHGPDIDALAQAGQVRQDLFYRLDVLRIDVAPLRERRDDVPLLLDHISEACGRRLDVTPSALQLLVDYAWPGNLHELTNLVRRLVTVEKTVTTRDLPPAIRDGGAALLTVGGETTMSEMEKRMLVEALDACGGNKAQAARRLGIQRSTLYRLLDRHGLR